MEGETMTTYKNVNTNGIDYSVQQDNAGWVVVAETKPRWAISHHKTETLAKRAARKLAAVVNRATRGSAGE